MKNRVAPESLPGRSRVAPGSLPGRSQHIEVAPPLFRLCGSPPGTEFPPIVPPYIHRVLHSACDRVAPGLKGVAPGLKGVAPGSKVAQESPKCSKPHRSFRGSAFVAYHRGGESLRCRAMRHCPPECHFRFSGFERPKQRSLPVSLRVISLISEGRNSAIRWS